MTSSVFHWFKEFLLVRCGGVGVVGAFGVPELGTGIEDVRHGILEDGEAVLECEVEED